MGDVAHLVRDDRPQAAVGDVQLAAEDDVELGEVPVLDGAERRDVHPRPPRHARGHARDDVPGVVEAERSRRVRR